MISREIHVERLMSSYTIMQEVSNILLPKTIPAKCHAL